MNESLSDIKGSWAKEGYIVKVQGLGMLRFHYLTDIPSANLVKATVEDPTPFFPHPLPQKAGFDINGVNEGRHDSLLILILFLLAAEAEFSTEDLRLYFNVRSGYKYLNIETPTLADYYTSLTRGPKKDLCLAPQFKLLFRHVSLFQKKDPERGFEVPKFKRLG